MNLRVGEILKFYERQGKSAGQEETLSALREIQEVLGCIPKAVQEEASLRLGVKPSFLAAFVKKYPEFKEVSEKYEIQVCTGPSCGAGKALEILRAVEAAGKQKEREQGISVKIVKGRCTRQCGKGPNLKINGVLHHHMTPEQAAELIRLL